MAFVQGDRGSTTNTWPVATAGITTTSGNTIVAVVSINSSRTVTGLTDNKGNTYTALAGNPQQPNLQFNVYAFYCENIVGGAAHVLTAAGSGTSVGAISVAEFSGRATSSVVSFQGNQLDASGGTSHSSVATGTLGVSGCDLVCVMADNGNAQFAGSQTYTATSTGWSLDTSSQVVTGATTATSAIFYRNGVGTGSDQATWTNSGGSLIAASWIVALAPSGSATKYLRNKLMTTGVGA